MLPLATTKAQLNGFELGRPSLLKLTSNALLPSPLRRSRAFIVREDTVPLGFGVYVGFESRGVENIPAAANFVVLPDEFSYLCDGDVLRIMPARSSVRVLYRRASSQNFALVTERCNNYCLMCSQPPKLVDDSWIVDDLLNLLPLIDRGTKELIFTGGEPTLLGERFIALLRECRSWLPETAIHILSNGRAFADLSFAERYAAVQHRDMMVGIPIYSDLSDRHDYVVQADGAFDETIRGILNLKQLRQRVEIRVVLHRQTVHRLPYLAEFIARNLRFVDQVALMGLEMTGFTKANFDTLWIDPYDYQAELLSAVETLDNARVKVKIYNHQLCVLDKSLWPYAYKSISDWKNEYMDECNRCDILDQCGGFFSSAKLDTALTSAR